MSDFWNWYTSKPSVVRRDLHAGDTSSNVRIGTIVRVNNEKMTCDVQYTYGEQGIIADVPFSLPFATQRGFIGGMPEVGSQAVLLMVKNSQNEESPLIISYLPPYFPVYAYNNDKISSEASQIPGYRSTVPSKRLKNQRLYPGEIFISSDKGSDIRLDEDIILTNNKLNEIQLRGSDQSIVLNSLQYYRATDASIKIDGMVTRYMETTFDYEGNLLDKSGTVHDNFGFDPKSDKEKRLNYVLGYLNSSTSLVTPDLNQNFIMLDNGNYSWIRTLSGKLTIDDPYLVAYPQEISSEDKARIQREVSYSSLPLTESRFAIKEMGDSILNQSFPFLQTDAEVRSTDYSRPLSGVPKGAFVAKNLIESVQGTLVGYDFEGKPELYGKVLRHQLFLNQETTQVFSDEIAIEDDALPDFAKTRTWAVASMWKMPSTTNQTRFYVNKEGYISFHIGSTRSKREHIFLRADKDKVYPVDENPIGAGRSVEGSFGGSVRLLIEKDYKEESLELTALGRSFINLGCDDRTDYGYRPKTVLDGKEVQVGVFEANDLTNKKSDRISLDMTTDGGIILRVGKNSGGLARRFRHNGYDPKGFTLNREAYRTSKNLNKDKSFYSSGDSVYSFHDMQMPSIKQGYKSASTRPVISNPNRMASSLDAHFGGDVMLRVGADPVDNKSVVMDLAGALVAAIGKDSHDSRSIQAVLDGGIELDVGKIAKTGHSLQGILRGDVDLRILASSPKNTQDNSNPQHQHQNSGSGGSTEGNKAKLHKGSIRYNIEGNSLTKINGRQEINIGGDRYENIGGNEQSLALGNYKKTIGNSMLSKTAYEMSAIQGSMRLTTNIGDIKLDTKAGDVIIDTILGKMDYKTKSGNITVNTLSGNFEGSSILGNVTISTSIGNAKLATSTGNVEVSTSVGNASLSTEIGTASIKSKILAEIISEAIVSVKANLFKIDSPVMLLGAEKATHPVPYGDQLLIWLSTHVHGMPGTPPVIPPTPALLSTTTFTS